jgi:hypothetical protein
LLLYIIIVIITLLKIFCFLADFLADLSKKSAGNIFPADPSSQVIFSCGFQIRRKFSAENETKNYSKFSCEQSEGNSTVCRKKFPRKCIFARNSAGQSPKNIILQEIPQETYKKCKKKIV